MTNLTLLKQDCYQIIKNLPQDKLLNIKIKWEELLENNEHDKKEIDKINIVLDLIRSLLIKNDG